MSFLLGITESFQRLWRRTPTRNWLIAFISCCVIGFVAGFVWAKVAEAAPAPQKAPVNYAPATDLRPGADFGPYANLTRAREAFQWPVLDVNLAIKRSRVHTYTRCRKMEYTIELAKVILCEAYGVFGKKCRRQSLYDTARVNCPVWWRMYHVQNDMDRHCEGKVQSWLYRDATSPTGWMIDSRLYNVRCYWDSQLG